MFGSSYNAPRLHVAIEARKIVISGEVAGLQIQLGPPAVPGRFDSCDLPPISLYRTIPKSTKPLLIPYISIFTCILKSTDFNLHQVVFGGTLGGSIFPKNISTPKMVKK